MSLQDADSESHIIEVLRALVSIPSINPSVGASGGTGEAAIAEFACGWLRQQGVASWTEEVAPGRLNALARIEGGEGPTVVLCAHLDTVDTEGMTIPPFEARIENGRLYGRGAYDMKGSAAAIMSAMARLRARDFPGCVMAALVCDEEYASIGAYDFVKRHRGDACIVTEPSEGSLVLAHKGFVWAEILATGRAAHGSRWDLGVSAVTTMSRIVAALDEFDRNELRRRVHPLVGPASLHCAMVHGGTALSTYAAECRLKVERRTIPGETPEQVRSELETIVRRVDEAARVVVFFARDPLTCDPDAAIVSSVRDAVTSVVGEAPPETGVGYWMDAAVFAAAGIPTVNYGTSGAGAHEAVEWVDLSSVRRVAAVLTSAALQFCRTCRTPLPGTPSTK